MGEATFGKYRLIAELGHGGMADVFLAVIAGPVGSNFTKLTVVKRLRQNLAEEPEFVEMLVDEARIAARLNHPNVVQTNEVGSVGNQYFLAMEYLDGQPLHRIQHRATQKAQRLLAGAATTPPPSPVEAASPSSAPSSVLLAADPFPRECQYLVLVDTLAGLHHAHELADYDGTPLGIVHRDVTPHNVFVTYEGQVKVVDFGIAKAVGRASETRQGVVKGKVRYMAPEQAIGQPVDRRADVFSVGVMLWEAATGRRLWKDMDDLNIVQALVGGNIKSSPREFDLNVPEEIDRICKKALAFNVDERYASAEDFRGELEQCLAELGMLTSARRRLAAGVSELFKDKRDEIKGVIEKQLTELKVRTSGEMKAVPLDSSSGSLSAALPFGAHSAPPPIAIAEESSPNSVSDSAATEFYTGTKKPEKGGRGWSLVAVAAALAAALVVVAVNARGRKPEASPATSTSLVETTASDIRIKIVTTPPTAQVTIDRALLTTPSDARMPRDKREHVVRIMAPGFEPAVETVVFENDITMNVVLTKPAPAGGPVTGERSPTGGAGASATKAAPPTKPTVAAIAAPLIVATPPPPPAPPPPTTAASAPTHKVAKPAIDDGDPWVKR